MTLFRNEFVRDRACAKEIFRYYVFSRVIVRIMYGFYAFCLGLCIIGGIIIGDFGSALLIVGIVAFHALTMLLNYHIQVKTTVERDREMSGGTEMLTVTEVTDSELRVTACGNTTVIPHDAIRSAYRTKNYIVIITRAKMMYIFKNDCYSVGNAEELWVFLKKKRVKFI